MKYRALSNMAASSLIIATTMVGCSGAAFQDRAGKSAAKMQQMAAAQARDAEKAIARRQAGKAVAIAEAAVAASPDEAAYRVLLGRAYLLDGRYASAKAAFEDALTLGSSDSRAIVNVALIETAQGHAEAGRTVLADHIDSLTAADYGLAVAMAGAPDEAIDVLSRAIHDPDATARERQNLAYAYALAGRWAEARRMASFDLSPDEAAKRVMNWARLAQPGGESRRVIAMIGVDPRADDAGLPVRLALAPAASGARPVREAAVAAGLEFAPQAPVETADAAMAEPAAEPASAIAEPASPAAEPALRAYAAQAAVPPLIAAPVAPARVTFAAPAPAVRLARHAAPTPVLKVAIPASRPFVRAAAAWSPVDPSRGSSWVVQFGAFSSRQAAQAGRAAFLRQNAALKAFPVIDSVTMRDGRSFYRVAVAGFGDRSGAERLCGSLRAKGGSCFVRMGGSEAAPMKWAQALKGTRQALLAMR